MLISPPATHIPFEYFTVRIFPTVCLPYPVNANGLFGIHVTPPLYEYDIRFIPPLLVASRIALPPTAIRKFFENVGDHIVASAPFVDRTMTLDVSFPNTPCPRPALDRHNAPTPAPTPLFDIIPVVKREIGIFAEVTAFVQNDGDLSELFNCVLDTAPFQLFAPFAVDVQPMSDEPAPQLANHAVPVHNTPLNLPYVEFNVPRPLTHPALPSIAVVYETILL